jgi:hypothetical protein
MAKEMLKRKDGSYPREVSGITSVLLKVLERNLLKLCRNKRRRLKLLLKRNSNGNNK